MPIAPGNAQRPEPSDPGIAEQLSAVVTTTTLPPSWWVLLATGLFGVLATVTDGVFRRANLIGLLAHEGGHALMALLCGGRVLRIELYGTHGGVTESERPDGWPAVLTSVAGYASPPLVGLGCALLIAGGNAPIVVFCSVLSLAAVLLTCRDLLSLSLVVLASAALAGILWWTPPWVHVWTACTLMWLTLWHSCGGILDLVRDRIHDTVDETDDAMHLDEETGIPDAVWIALWGALLVGCWWGALRTIWPW